MELLAQSPVSFTHPLFLLLLAPLPLFAVLATRRRVPRGPWPLALWLRLTVAALVVLALAGLRLPAPAKSVATVFVVDASSSVPADIREGTTNWVRQAMATRGPDDLVGIVTFGRDARVELPLGQERDHSSWGELPAASATDIGSALELAAGLLPHPKAGPLRRIVLLSDGNQNQGDAQHALLRPALQDVEVAVLSLPTRLEDAAITGMSAPPMLREGEAAEIRVALLSLAKQEAALRVWARGAAAEHLLYDERVQLDGDPRELVVNAGDLPQGSWAFRAQLESDSDSRPENNESWAHTIVREPAHVLLVEGTAGEASALRTALVASKVQVDTLRVQQFPAQLERLLPYEAVVLANVHGTELRRDQMSLLQSYTAVHGRGVVVVGGERTFGLGDYQDTLLEEMLPVTVQPPDRDQAASLALLLVIDRSGSMSALDTQDRRASRMELAKEGAIQAVETLKEGDQVGVIAFDYSPRWVSDVRMIAGPADIRAVSDRIATIQPDGGTDIYSGLEMAYRGLVQVSARVKHVILLTDGESSPAGFPALMTSMRRAGMTVSAVGVSAPDNGVRLLQDITRRGQGRLYTTNSASDVPRIMTQEARLAGKSFRQERDFRPRLVTAAPAVRGLVPAEFPMLHGHVRVTPKPASETVLTSDQEEVVMSQWQYGLGRALVWTADAQGDWSRDWVDTPQFKKLWPQAVRWTMPAPVTPGLQVAVSGDGEQALVRVESFEPTGELRSLLPTYADVVPPDDAGRRVPLPQVAPGRYEGRFSLVGPGVYFLRVTQLDDDGQVLATQLAGYALPHLPEHQLSAPNRALLERLAADTGGPLVSQPEDSWRRDTRRSQQPQEVWTYLLMAALALFVLDAAARRIRFSSYDFVDLRSAAQRLAGGARRPWGLPRVRLHPLRVGRR